MIAVVIPYFQRSPGVLRRALASIAAQQGCPVPVRVIVVDDTSPVPAQAEVDAVAMPPAIEVQVITQPNGGPGAARNTALDAVPAGTRYVAFLDSDDEWSADHLARGRATLEQGFDFYFADLLQLDQTISGFTRAGRIKVEQHPALDGSLPGLHAYQGDMIDQIIRGNIIGTSTAMYRFERFSDIRFLREFRNVGEDYLFWMSLVSRGARIALSSQVEATYGRGVNVYSGAGWGTPEHLQRIHDEMRYRKSTGRLIRLDAGQRTHIARAVTVLRRSFVQDLLHRLQHRSSVPAGLMRRHLLPDPLIFLSIPLVGASMLFRR